jgi:hypothetical protein
MSKVTAVIAIASALGSITASETTIKGLGRKLTALMAVKCRPHIPSTIRPAPLQRPLRPGRRCAAIMAAALNNATIASDAAT